MSRIIPRLDEATIEKTARRCKKRGIKIPTFAQLRDPSTIDPSIAAALPKVGLWDVDPKNLFRITWKNDVDTGLFGGVNYLEIPRELTRGKAGVYALQVKGMSMVDALINDGDIVLMQYVNVIENGEMAAVWLKAEKEATLKKVYVEPDRIRLQPANSQMQPIYIAPDNVEIQGKVIAVIRQVP